MASYDDNGDDKRQQQMTPQGSSESAAVWIIYGLVIVYALCFQFQRPIEPFLVDKLVKSGGEDATLALGRVEAVFSVAQGFGSLIMGYVLDKFGVKTGLILTFLSCAAQYYILSITESLNMLFFSKVPGMFMAGFLCAQTAMAKVTSDGDERMKALGRLTSAYTVGGLAGPFLGGQFGSTGNFFLGAQLATGGSLLAIVFVLMLPASVDSKPKVEDTDAKSEAKSDPRNWFTRAALVLRLAGPLLLTKIISGIGNNMARSVQSVILKNDLGFDEAKMGSMMSGQFAFGGLANAFLLAPLARFLGGQMEKVVRNCIVAMGVAYIVEAVAFAPQMDLMTPGSGIAGGFYIVIALFLSLFQYSLATSITAGTQELVPKTMQGTLMGIEHCLFSVAGMAGPMLGTRTFRMHGLSGLCLACSACFFAALFVLHVPGLLRRSSKSKNT